LRQLAHSGRMVRYQETGIWRSKEKCKWYIRL